MTHEEQFEEILKQSKQDAIIPFFKKLSTQDKRDLAKPLKKYNKEYLDFQSTNNRYGRPANDNQQFILEVANVVCSDYKTVKNTVYWPDFELLDKILPWHVPSWLDTYFASIASQDFAERLAKYEKLMEYSEKNYFKKPLPLELLGKAINYASLDTILKREVSYTEHIWYLFRYECQQNKGNFSWVNEESYVTKTGKQAQCELSGVIADLIHLEKIPRQRVLTETLAATHSHLNKALLCWFTGLFEFLEPTHDEIIQLQDNLFAVFQSTHSKPLNIALKYLAKIAKDDAFDAQEFLNHVPQLFSSTVKATHNATFKVLNVLVKNKAYQPTVLLVATHAFFISDAATQGKAVKLITKYGKTDDAELTESLSMYSDTILSQTKQDLADFLGSDTEVFQLPETLEFDDELVAIKSIDTFDDLVFLLPSVFENNHIYDYELALDGLVRLQDALIPENFEKLTPAFSAAYKYLRKSMWDTEEYLRMFAILLVDLLRKLVNDFPEDTLLKTIDDKFIKKCQKERWHFCIESENLESFLKSCFVKYDGLKKIDYGDIFWKFAACKQCIENGIAIGFLSTPTHEPSFVEPMVFLQRVKAYQKNGSNIHTYDFQQCLYRIIRNNFHQNQLVKAYIENELSSEPQAVLRFFYDGTIAQKKFTTYPEWWMTASLLISPKCPHNELESITYHSVPRELLSGHIPWQITEHQYTYENMDYKTRDSKTIEVTSQDLALIYPDTEHLVVDESWWRSRMYYIETPKSELLIEKLIKPLGMRHVGYGFLASSLLNQFDHVTHNFIHSKLYGSDAYDVDLVKHLETIITFLNTLPKKYSDNENLFFIKTMLCDVKALRQFAAEMWIRRLSTIDNIRLGNILGRLEAVEHAPLKRFTDLIQDNMLNVSHAHNHALLDLLLAMLVELPEKPVKGLKKLLEILVEVLQANQTNLQSVASDELMLLLNAWQKVANLKKVVKVLVSD